MRLAPEAPRKKGIYEKTKTARKGGFCSYAKRARMKLMAAQDTVAQIKERLSIQDVITPYVKLRRAGKSMVGLCPFHKEKSPSFHVSPERGSWHCFGCGEGGDAFSFIEKIEGVDFKGALTMLAEKAGVQIEYTAGASGEDRSKKDRLRAVMARASEWYVGQMKESPAYAYAESRGLHADTIKVWHLGYAPDAWRMLLEALTAEGFTREELIAAGLVKEADGKPGTYYDRFRNRLMFPLRDVTGNVVAFTGRTLADDEPAKYLNSPETELFHKSAMLFGMDLAKEAIRQRKFTMLVEGQLDVLLAHQEGFANAVALSGTALSATHVSLMKRYSENLMLVLDSDPAGLTATARSAMLALGNGLRVKAARLPKGKDPADLLSEDPKLFAVRITAAKPIVEFFLTELSESESNPHRLLQMAERIVLPLVKAIPSPIERDHFTQITAQTLGVSAESIKESLARIPAEILETAAPTLGTVKPLPKQAPLEMRRERLLAAIEVYAGTPLAERVKTRYCQITEADLPPRGALSEAVLFSVEQAFGENPEETAADELLEVFEEVVVREKYQQAVANLRRAEASNDAALIEEAQQLCATLSSRLALLGK